MKKNNKTKVKMSYEPEADVLRIEASNKPIEYAAEVGNVIVHFTKEDTPVYFEVLEASKFLKEVSALIPSKAHRNLVNK